jgi:hypothetical protein
MVFSLESEYKHTWLRVKGVIPESSAKGVAESVWYFCMRSAQKGALKVGKMVGSLLLREF